jgi:hypothetical protein
VTNDLNEKNIKLWTPVAYRIEVNGYLDESWSDRLAGMQITSRKKADQTIVSSLEGRLMDQAELSGVLRSLYNMHVSILKVEAVDSE